MKGISCKHNLISSELAAGNIIIKKYSYSSCNNNEDLQESCSWDSKPNEKPTTDRKIYSCFHVFLVSFLHHLWVIGLVIDFILNHLFLDLSLFLQELRFKDYFYITIVPLLRLVISGFEGDIWILSVSSFFYIIIPKVSSLASGP